MSFLNKREWMRSVASIVLVVFFLSIFTGGGISFDAWAEGEPYVDMVKDNFEGDPMIRVLLINAQNLAGKALTASIYDEAGTTQITALNFIKLEAVQIPNFAEFKLPDGVQLQPGRYTLNVFADGVAIPPFSNEAKYLSVVPRLMVKSQVQNVVGSTIQEGVTKVLESPYMGWSAADALAIKILDMSSPTPIEVMNIITPDERVTVTDTELQIALGGLQMSLEKNYSIEVRRSADYTFLGREKLRFTGIGVNNSPNNTFGAFPAFAHLGLYNTDRTDAFIDIYGETTTPSGTMIPFTIRLNSVPDIMGEYENELEFAKDIDYAAISEADKTLFIPVKPDEENAIKLMYKDAAGMVIATTMLKWTPQSVPQIVLNNTPNKSYTGLQAMADIGVLNTDRADGIVMVTGRSRTEGGSDIQFYLAADYVVEKPGDYHLMASFINDVDYPMLDTFKREKTIPVKPDTINDITLEYRDSTGAVAAVLLFEWVPATMGEGPKFYLKNAVNNTYIGMAVKPEIILAYSGSSAVYESVYGISSAYGQPGVSFKIQFDSVPEKPGAYRGVAYFINEADYQNLDETQRLNAIPVRPDVTNEIHIEYRDANGKVITGMPFKWEPGQPGEELVWSNVIRDPNWSFPMVGKNPEIFVEITDFLGNESNLAAELNYYNPTTNALEVKCRLNNLTLISQYENRKIYKLSWVNGDINELANAPYDLRLEASVLYNDSTNGIHLQRNIGEIRVDVYEPKPYARLEGIVDGQLKVRVDFNDGIDMEKIQMNKDIYFAMIAPDGTRTAPISVSGVRYAGEPEWEPIRSVDLYFPMLNDGGMLEIKEVSDLAGNVMTAPSLIDIKPMVQINGTVKDLAGNMIPNAWVRMAKMDGLPSATMGYIHMEDFGTDPSGKFDRWVSPGTYKVTEISYPMADGTQKRISMDQEVNISLSSTGGSYYFDVQPLPANVFGKVARDTMEAYEDQLVFINTMYLQDPWTTMDFHQIEKVFGRDVMTDVNGNFGIDLKPGTYKLLGKRVGYSIIKPVNEVIVTVPTAGNYNITPEIVFPKMNVTGTLRDNAGNIVANASVVITNVSETPMPPFMAFTDMNGKFGAILGDGSYRIEQVIIEHNKMMNGGLYQMDVQFDVVNTQPTNVTGQNQVQNTLDGVTLPAANVHVGIVENGVPLPIEDGFAFMDFALNGHNMGLNTETGKYDFYLKPGTYTINSLHTRGMAFENLGQVIVVNTGDTNVIHTIDIAKQCNVIIKLADDKGTPLQNIGIPVDGVNNDRHEWRKTNANGEVYFNFAPGQYRINGYDMNGMWKELNKEFTVGPEHTNANPFVILVTVQSPNVQGWAEDEAGQFITRGWVSIKRLPDGVGSYEEYFGFQTDEYGKFAVYLKPGTYVVDGVGTPEKWHEMKLKFTVIIENGITKIQMPDGSILTGGLKLKKQPDNVSGFLYKGKDVNGQFILYKGRSGEPGYDPNTMPLDVHVLLREVGISDEQYWETPWLYEIWVPVKADGSFHVNLEMGKQYYPKAVIDAGRYLEINMTDKVIQPPVSGLIIMPPPPNFKGTVVDYDGNPVTRAWINLQKADSNEWIGMETDEKGDFGRNLEVGVTYIIKDIYKHTETKMPDGTIQYNSIQYVYNKAITITANMNPILLAPNVKGTISMGDLNSGTANAPNTAQYAGIVIRPDILETDPRYTDMKENPWKYESWISLAVDQTGVGSFAAYLEEGNYKIVGISSSNGWVEVNRPFSINKTSNGIVTYDSMKNRYALNLDYQPNVIGIVKDAKGLSVTEAWVNIDKIVPGQDAGYWMSEKYFGAGTNSTGTFKLKLEDGDYRISGFHTKGNWKDNAWEPGKWVEVGFKFKVVGGQLKTWEGNPLSTIMIQPNVSGIVKKYYKAGDVGQPDAEGYVQLNDAWVALKLANELDKENRIWAHTGGSGEFNLMLAPGQYVIVETGGPDFWAKTNIPFTIDTNKQIVSDGKYVINGQLVVKPERPNIIGKAYKDKAKQEVVKWGGIVIKPLNAKEEEWEKAIWIGTKEDGYFDTFLPQGQWKIVGMSTQDFWQRLYIPLDVDAQGKVTTPVPGIIGTDGQMTLTPPDPNITGIIKDKNNVVISKEAWINIKREGTDVNEWNQYFGIQYKEVNGQFQFADNLEPGTYTVTSAGGMDFWFECDTKFIINTSGVLQQVTPGTVENGKLIIAPTAPNVTGKVYGTINGTKQLLSKGWLCFARFDDTGKQVTMGGQPIAEGYQPNADGVYWEHARWAEVDDAGNFEILLPAGNYKVVSVGAQGLWYQPDQSFTVTEGQMSTLEVDEPAPNVTIIVKNTGSTATEGWINVSIKKDDVRFYFPVKLSHKNGTDFVFKAWLKAGEYIASDFGSTDIYLPLEHKFTAAAEGNTVITIDYANQTAKSVLGTITNGTSPIDGKAWVAIMPVVNGQIDTTAEKKWVQTDADQVGKFRFKLEAGTQWAVVEISTSTGYYKVSNPMSYVYNVTEATEQTGWNINLQTITTP